MLRGLIKASSWDIEVSKCMNSLFEGAYVLNNNHCVLFIKRFGKDMLHITRKLRSSRKFSNLKRGGHKEKAKAEIAEYMKFMGVDEYTIGPQKAKKADNV